MAGDYFVETYLPTDKAASKENASYFPDFASAKAFAEQAEADGRWSKVRLHLPARATDEERRQAREAGWVSN